VNVRTLGSLSLLFFATRATILLGYATRLTDVSWLYYPIAATIVGDAAVPYRDVPFPYPPLALVPTLLPALVGLDYTTYHRLFRLEFVAVDFACLLLLGWFVGRGLGLGDRRAALAATLYCLLGLPLGYILYDRIDLLIALAFLASVALYRPSVPQGVGYYGTIAAGALTKVVPVFWLPFACVPDLLAGGRGRWAGVRACARGFVLPVATVLVATQFITHGALTRSLGAHTIRGIEIESVWATPFLLLHVTGLGPTAVEDTFGSHNLASAGVPSAILVAASYLGFALLAVLYAWHIRVVRATNAPASPTRHFQLAFGTLLVLLASQRVLSPQYFVWVLPGFCVEIVRSRRGVWYAALVSALYVLTLLVFPIQWEGLTRLDPIAVATVTARNLILVALTARTWTDIIGGRDVDPAR